MADPIILNISNMTTEKEIRSFFGRIMDFFLGSKNEYTHLVAKEVFNDLVARTPVKTGWARSRWHVTIGEFEWRPGERDSKGSYGPPIFNLSAKRMHKVKNFQIGNDAAYIQYLLYGSENMVPQMSLEQSIDTGIAMADLMFKAKNR
jgi:hypothetical protein